MDASCKIYTVFLVLCLCAIYVIGATVGREHFKSRLERSSGYLPPYPGTNFGTVDLSDKTHKYSSYSIQSSPSVDTINQHTSTGKSFNSHAYKPYTSYAPPTIEDTTLQHSVPRTYKKISHSGLIPKTDTEQFSTMAELSPQQQLQQEQDSDVERLNTRVLMIEEPMAKWLTPIQNKTVEAAKLLASTLLEANGEAQLKPEALPGMPLVNPSTLQDPNKLNTTDVVIVKSHKNAYIIPPHLAEDARNPITVRELYEMRNQLEKAYTINQFIFIIKPEKINFLNKLV